MKIVDCSRCWFSRRKRLGTGSVKDIQYGCAHPDRAKAIPKPVLGPTSLVQLVVCPRNR